jgi:Na+-driven multidrug efflux pump
MPATPKLRKWHFLLLGAALILIAGYLWYWDWRSLGLPAPIRAEHYITIFTFFVGFLVLGIFVYRLTRRQVSIMLIGLTIVNVLAALGTAMIFRTYPAVFDLLQHAGAESADAVTIAQWRDCFMRPALYAMHIGLILLWAESMVMFFVRKPTDQPE